ncbi:MAG: hypothetical protein KME45_27340 [Stenomitos rutilans HA7619-LM2]|jgi:hypothetical protein|nr:hypothetical protein [Stenomitos rutilans HA7619-LM2]
MLTLRLETPVELESGFPSELATKSAPPQPGLRLMSPQAPAPGPGPYDAVLGGKDAYRPPPSATISGPTAPRSPIGPSALNAAAEGAAVGPLAKLAGPLSLLPQTLDSVGRAVDSSIDTGSAWRDYFGAKGDEDKYLAKRLKRLSDDPSQSMSPFELEGVKNRIRKRNPNAVPPWVKPIDPNAGNLSGYGDPGSLYNVVIQVNAYNYDPFGGERRSTYEGPAQNGPFRGPILGVTMDPAAEVQQRLSGTGTVILSHGNPVQQVGVGLFDYSPNSRRESSSIARVTRLDGQLVQGTDAPTQNTPSIPATFNQSPLLLSPIPEALNPQSLPQSPTLQPQKQGAAQPQKLQQPQKLGQPQAQKQPQNLQQPQNYIPPQLVPNLPANYPTSTTPTPTTTQQNLTGGNNPFPKNYQQVGTPQTQQTQQPQTPQTMPPRCEDPCIAELQKGQDEAKDFLDKLLDFLTDFADQQQEYQVAQQQQQQDNTTKTTISVPVCSCNEDGTASLEMMDIELPNAIADSVKEQFEVMANIQSAQCQIQRHTERSYNVLGGDIWFKDPEGRTPEYKVKLERRLKEVGTVFGFPAIPDEDPTAVAIEEEQARLTGQPIPGQVKIKNLVSLINLYTSNLYHRAGYQGLPASVPKTLLGYTDNDDPEIIQDFATYFVWFVKQVDGLIGKFPINITIEDVDPLTEGNQTKQVELPNISEALAEMYGLNISSSVNGDVAVNFLMRLASEVIATKNSSLITQDYVRANAAFLGYKGNPARREINYSFDAAKLGSLDEFLNESKGYVVGWEEDDKESIVGFLQRIVFSAGIIKAAFFRDKNRLAELQKEIESMMTGDKTASDAEWEALLALINGPTNYFNKDSIPQPRVRNKPADPPQEPTP